MSRLRDEPISVRSKLSALWTATMFCYVYGDYFGLYVAGKLAAIARGSIGPLGPASPGTLVAVALMMAAPAMLIAATLLAPAVVSRWSNVAFGVIYTAIIALTAVGAQPFYIVLAVIEMALTSAVVCVAWTWPAEK